MTGSDRLASACAAASELLAAYQDALTILCLSQAPMLDAPDFRSPAACAAVQANLEKAGRKYWEHVRRHDCRGKLFMPQNVMST